MLRTRPRAAEAVTPLCEPQGLGRAAAAAGEGPEQGCSSRWGRVMSIEKHKAGSGNQVSPEGPKRLSQPSGAK